MADFVANFDLERNEIEAEFDLEQPVQFDALFKINPAGASWGSITGTLSNQTDLKNELDTLSGQIDSNHQAITEINTTIQGYGDIVTYNASDFATSAQGLLADTALQPNDNISELTNDVGYITSASLPIVNNGILTIQKNGSNVAVFSANQSGNQTANIIVPTDTSDLTNNAGYTTNIGTVTSVNDVSPDSEGNVTLSIPAAQVNSDWNASSGVAEILNKPNLATVATSGSYNDLSNKPTIPSEVTESTVSGWGFTKNEGTVTSVNNTQPINGNVTISIPDTSNLANKDLSNLSSTGNAKFQTPLVSGTNIKTINSTTLLGSGDIEVQPTIDVNNKLDSDLVDDTNQTHKFATASQLTQIGTNQSDISTINGKIPSQASTSNQLADKQYVDNAIQTNSAHFRGNWSTWANVPTNVNDYPADDDGNKTPTTNDYMVVQDASDYTGDTLEGAWQFTYTGIWSTNSKAGWQPRFQINESPLTPSQLSALNSGITSTLVTQIGTNQSNISSLQTTVAGKQDILVSGTNIKTINNESILGSGNIDIQTGGTVDDNFSTTSENPLQNKVITNALMDVTTGSYYVYGSPTISNNIISNMSTSDYILTDYVWNCTSSDNWALTIKIQDFDYTLANSPMIFTNSLDDTKSIEIGFSNFYLYVKLSSDGSTWDIADTFYTHSNFIGGNTEIVIQYDQYGSLTVLQSTAQGYWMQLAGYTNSVYNTNSQMKIYNSIGSTGISINLANSSMVVNSSTVWNGANGAIAYTPKFQEKLVSGTNIKTVNNTSLLGSGNIDTSEVFIAEYGVTSFTDIETAYNAGKVVFCKYNNFLYVLQQFMPVAEAIFTAINSTSSGIIHCDYSTSVGTNGWFAQYNTLQSTVSKVTSISIASTDTQYPSAKCVYNELADKADTDLSNLSSTGQKVIDGDFVPSAKDLSSVKAVGSYTIDLQSYLPSDGAKYEVWLTGSNYTSGSTYTRYKLYTDVMNAQLPVNSQGANYPWLTHTGTNSREGCFIIKVPVERYIYEIIEGAAFNDRYVPLTALGYRRIGTNS